MAMNIVGAVAAGVAGTIVMSILLMLAPMMGLPKMDIVGMLAMMFTKTANTALGWILHLMMGIVFAIIYAVLWSAGVGAAGAGSGALFGAAHWLIVGVIMGMGVALMHAGVKVGTVKAPGYWMAANGNGLMAFIGGLIGHVVFGLVVGLVYTAIH
jgi:uncharacterized membrane protein YagU involved in acid resistance